MPNPYFSELKFQGAASLDFIEVAVNAGLDVSGLSVVVYNPNGTIRTTNDLGTSVSTTAGRDVYLIDTATSGTFNGLHRNGAVALVQDGTVVSFLSFNRVVTATEGPADGMESTQLGGTGGGQSLETTDDGATYSVQGDPTPGTIPCFLTGTQILTSRGYHPVETLRAGDRIMTVDQGMQPLIWAGARALTLSAMADPDLRPIRIPAGSLAPGLPHCDLYLSPNHCLALDHPACNLLFHQPQVLASVKSMLGFRGIGHRPIAAPVTYHHLLFERHQIIWANGAPSESLYPGPLAISAFGDKEQAEIQAVVSALENEKPYGPTARILLKPYEIRVLLADVAQADALASPLEKIDPTAITHRLG